MIVLIIKSRVSDCVYLHVLSVKPIYIVLVPCNPYRIIPPYVNRIRMPEYTWAQFYHNPCDTNKDYTPFAHWIILKKHEYVFAFHIISEKWNGRDYLNSSSRKMIRCWICIINIMPAGDLALWLTRSSTAMILWIIFWDILFPAWSELIAVITLNLR